MVNERRHVRRRTMQQQFLVDQTISMSREIPGRSRVAARLRHYRELKMKILKRDAWKCQHCGRRDQLQIHHMIRRSQLGADGEENLIVLCSGCHHWLHYGRHAE